MIDKAARDNLLAIVGVYAAATERSLSTISGIFHGKQTFLTDFQAGKCSITLTKLAEMLQALSDQWPPGARWPTTKPLTMKRPVKNGVASNPHQGKKSVKRKRRG